MYDFVAPSQWQNFCRARGRNAKEIKNKITTLEESGIKKSKILSIQAVKDVYGIETENDNLADAVMIGHYVVNKIDIPGSKKEKEK